MKTYTYKGFAEGGRRTRGLIEASDLKEARERLSGQGILTEELRAVEDAAAGVGTARRGFRNVVLRSTIYRELAALLDAGFPLIRGVELLMDAPDITPARQDLAGMRDRIRGGQDPATAFAEVGAITEFERAVLESGQRAGELGRAVERLADYLEEQIRLNERVRGALLYPAIVGSLALVVAGLLLGVMLPKFSRMWVEARIPLPVFTKMVMAAGRWFVWIGTPAALLLVASVPLARRALRQDIWAERRDRWLYGLPVAGRTWAALMCSRFGRTLALLLQAGVPLLEALPLAGRATGSAWVRKLVASAVEQVRHGGHLAEALRSVPPLAGALAGWVQAGESGGNLPAMLLAGAGRAQAQWERRLERATRLLEPALILVLGGMVFAIALAVLLPILSLNRSIG